MTLVRKSRKMTPEERRASARERSRQRALTSLDRDIAYAQRLEAELVEEIAAVRESIVRFEAERAELQNEIEASLTSAEPSGDHG